LLGYYHRDKSNGDKKDDINIFFHMEGIDQFFLTTSKYNTNK